MKLLKNIPEEIDYNEFKWLRHGDRLKIATTTGMSPSMVRATLRKETFNLAILAEAMKVVIEKKKKLLELQAESKNLSQALTIKVA